MITAQDYLDGLNQLRRHARYSSVLRPQVGVCGNLSTLLYAEFQDEMAYRLVELYGAEWEHATFYTDLYGERHLDAYFVPRTRNCGTWEGENLRMRLLLIDFLIECVQIEINRGVSVLAL